MMNAFIEFFNWTKAIKIFLIFRILKKNIFFNNKQHFIVNKANASKSAFKGYKNCRISSFLNFYIHSMKKQTNKRIKMHNFKYLILFI